MALQKVKHKQLSGYYALRVAGIVETLAYCCNSISTFISKFNTDLSAIPRRSTATADICYKIIDNEDKTATIYSLTCDGQLKHKYFTITQIGDGEIKDPFNF